jgi:hypothetical protein
MSWDGRHHGADADADHYDSDPPTGSSEPTRDAADAWTLMVHPDATENDVAFALGVTIGDLWYQQAHGDRVRARLRELGHNDCPF